MTKFGGCNVRNLISGVKEKEICRIKHSSHTGNEIYLNIFVEKTETREQWLLLKGIKKKTQLRN
jgi:hypothetical protein